MKIAYLAKRIDPRGGGGRYATSTISGMRKLGHEVVVLKEEEDGFEGLSILRSGFGIISSALKVRQATRDCDVVHALDVWPYALHAYLATIGTNKKMFVSGVGTYSVAPLDSFIKRMLLTIALRRAQNIICISKYVRDEMHRRLPLDVYKIIYMGFTRIAKLSEEEMAAKRAKYNLGNRRPILLTVGAIKHRKGQFDTLKSISLIKNQYPQILYVIIGTMNETAYINEMKEYASKHDMNDNILMIGNAKSDSELAFFYEECDLFIMNSNNDHGHFEGFGLVFLEAASFGKPVVGSSGCGIEDALSDGVNGFLSQQANHESIAQAIAGALEKKDVFGRNSIGFVNKFSWDKMVEKYLDLYKINRK